MFHVDVSANHIWFHILLKWKKSCQNSCARAQNTITAKYYYMAASVELGNFGPICGPEFHSHSSGLKEIVNTGSRIISCGLFRHNPSRFYLTIRVIHVASCRLMCVYHLCERSNIMKSWSNHICLETDEWLKSRCSFRQ